MRRTPAERELAVELAAHGLRATQQRIAVLTSLRRSRDHPTAASLHRQLRRRHPSLSQKTVYEALGSLVDAGLAACVTEGGEPYRYEANSAPHFHARCRVCGALRDLPNVAEGALRARTPLPDGFAVERVSVVLVGRCARCADAV